MNGVLFWSVAIVVGLAIGTIAWLAHRARKRHEQRRAQGYELIHSLKAYAAWIDCRRDEPFRLGEAGESTLPEPLERACAIKDAQFPGLAQQMMRLLQAHSRLVEYLWHQSMLRLSQQALWRPVWQDSQYQQIRGSLEELIQETIGLTQEAVGDRIQGWHRTGTDFSFSSGTSVSTSPDPPASA